MDVSKIMAAIMPIMILKSVLGGGRGGLLGGNGGGMSGIMNLVLLASIVPMLGSLIPGVGGGL